MALRIGRFRLPECGGHHWHVARRGWVCCHCPTRVKDLHRPADTGACAHAEVIDELQDWVKSLSAATAGPPPPRRRPVARRQVRVPV